MTVYGTSHYPVSNDWSLDTKQLLYFFSPRYKSFQIKNVVNKYLFSYSDDFICIQRLRSVFNLKNPVSSKYRVIGRFVSDFDYISICPGFLRGTDFDTFVLSDFDSCRCVFNRLVVDYINGLSSSLFS